MIRKIFLDLDGVLNLFVTKLFNRMGVWGDPRSYAGYPDVGFDIVAAYNALRQPQWHREHTSTSFWNNITRTDWLDVPISDEMNWLIGHAEALVGRDNVAILTATSRDPESAAGKVEWIYANLPKWLHRQYLIAPNKTFCAAPGNLLVDDSDKNVDAFTAAGGQALLVPRPWNRARGVPTLPFLKHFFEGHLHAKETYLHSHSDGEKRFVDSLGRSIPT